MAIRLFVWLGVLMVAGFNLINFMWTHDRALPPGERLIIPATVIAYTLMAYVIGVASDRVAVLYREAIARSAARATAKTAAINVADPG